MEAREARSVRFCPSDWDRLTAAARVRGVEVSVLVRDCCLLGLSLLLDPTLLEEHVKATSRRQIADVQVTVR